MKKKTESVDESAEMFAGQAPPPPSAPLTPLDIQQKEFRVSRMGGYRMRDVDEFLDVVTDRVSTLIAENERLQALAAGADGRAQGRPEVPADSATSSGADAGAVQVFLRNEGEFLRSLGALVQGHVEGVKEMARVAKAPATRPPGEVEDPTADVTDTDAGATEALPPIQVAAPKEAPISVKHASAQRTQERAEGSLRELFWGEEG